MKKRTVAVIDVGSNSIKCMVARSHGDGAIEVLLDRTREVRISSGIAGAAPVIPPDRLQAGVAAIAELWRQCQAWEPFAASAIVATSTVREAANRAAFAAAVTAATGQPLRILTGDAEAAAIARGIRADPLVRARAGASCTVFDQGGGSLELIRFADHRVADRVSLPLGAVRLTERWIPQPARPIPAAAQNALRAAVAAALHAVPFAITPPLVGAGGGASVTRQILAAEHRRDPLDPAAAVIHTDAIARLRARLCRRGLAARTAIAGLPASRADILPAALLTFETLLAGAGADSFLHSPCNLRWGIAAELLNG
jgi:exopolyphosphatase/guanosine-5'-triphosphate,3'-diphosphate pyrophosphatase